MFSPSGPKAELYGAADGFPATTVKSTDSHLAPGNAMPMFGYGYLLWVLPETHRQFAIVGALANGCASILPRNVMVETAPSKTRPGLGSVACVGETIRLKAVVFCTSGCVLFNLDGTRG